MSSTAQAEKTPPAPVAAESSQPSLAVRITQTVVRSVLPIMLALITAGLLILALRKDPLQFFGRIIEFGLLGDNWNRSLTLLAPLLIIAVGMILVFRAQLWNLGYDGQYLLGAVIAAGFGPSLMENMPVGLATLVILIGAVVIGAIWTLIPALLKARYGTNEIITTLVMSFIGVGLANLLIKGVFNDPGTPIPQTKVLEDAYLLPYIPGTEVHIGLIIAIVVAVAFQYLLTRTSFGLRSDIFGSSPKAARHVGINAGLLVVILFAISGALIASAGAIDILGEWRYQRANWNPALGASVLPFVFLARLSPIGSIPLLAFYAVMATGGTLAAQRAGLSIHFQLVIIALILVFMTITEYIGTKRSFGQSYLASGLKATLKKPIQSLGRGEKK